MSHEPGQIAAYFQGRFTDQERRVELLQQLFDGSPLGVLVTSAAGVFLEVNTRAEKLLGYSHEQLIGKRFVDITHPEDVEVGLAALKAMLAGERRSAEFEKRYIRGDGRVVWVSLCVTTITDAGEPFFVTYIQDIDDRKREQFALQESERQRGVIAAQRELLRQISAPLISIADGVVAMPLVGPIDDERVRQLLEVLLAGVVARRASVVIVDVTGVTQVDAAALAELLRAARAVALLGAETVLSGVNPAMAETMVALGVDLGGLRTIGQFQDAIGHALSRARGG
jgi:rsbT co-antagonist protein RsbR